MSAIAAARELYVNNLTGSDLNDGSSAETVGQGVGPVRTIEKALRVAEKGDRISLGNSGVPYRESVTLQAGRNSGWPDAPFRLEGNGATLDGSLEVPPEAWEHWDGGIFRFQPERKAHQELFHKGLPLERAAVVDFHQLPSLQPLQWCLFEGFIYFHPEEGRLPQSYQLTHSHHRVGLTLYMVRHVVVSNLTVQGYQLDGINCHSNVHDGAIVGVISRGNGRSGVSIGGASRVTLAGSLVGNNGEAQLRVEGFARVQLINNNLLDNTAPPIVNDGGIVTNNDDPPAAEAGGL